MSAGIPQYISFDEMVWPLPAPDLEWKLRYGNPSKSELLHAASILGAYQGLICRKTAKKREHVIRKINKVLSL